MLIAVRKPVAQSNAFRLDRPKFNRAESEAHAQFLCDRAKTIGRGLDVLFHGTRNRERILESGFLRSPRTTHAVSFGRSPKVAAHVATLPREDDEGTGAILVFDRSSLKTRFKLECIDDGWTTDASGNAQLPDIRRRVGERASSTRRRPSRLVRKECAHERSFRRNRQTGTGICANLPTAGGTQ
jgi:hypothetical protein